MIADSTNMSGTFDGVWAKMDKALELLHKLNLNITTVHLDMGGNHRYALNHKAHAIISEIKLYLSEVDDEPGHHCSYEERHYE